MAPWISHIHTPTCISFILPGSTEPQMPQVLAIFLLLRDSVPSEPPLQCGLHLFLAQSSLPGILGTE